MLKAYVGAALTGAPPEFVKGFLPLLKKKIRKMRVEVLDFIGLEGGTALVVFKHDRKCTENADICVFILDHPSTGLGMEIMLREATGKPAVFFARRGVRVTRMLLGFLEERGLKVHRYRSAIGICRILHEQMRELDPDYESSS